MTPSYDKTLVWRVITLLVFLNLHIACSPQSASEGNEPAEVELLFEKQAGEVNNILNFNLNKPEDEFISLIEGYRHLNWVNISPNGHYAVVKEGEALQIVNLIT